MELYRHITDAGLSCFAITEDEASLQKRYSTLLEELPSIREELYNQTLSGELPLLIPNEDDSDIEEILEVARHIRHNFSDVVILGTGGSTLCAQALLGFYYPSLPLTSPQIHFLPNTDATTIKRTLSQLNMEHTIFLAVSKSGGTLETLSQLSLCLQEVSRYCGDDELTNHFIGISDNKDSPLRRICAKHSIRVLEHVEEIGGRFSILTNVGLLPAAIAGMDIKSLRRGALQVSKNHLTNEDINKCEAGKAAIIGHLLHTEHNVSELVFFPYVDRLKALSTWLCQIWAESLGKNGGGTTPLSALGTLDQHSQMQLYLDGPKNKLFTLITLEQNQKGQQLPTKFLQDDELTWMHDHTMGDIMQASQTATQETLQAAGLPVIHLSFDYLNEEVLGALIMHFILQTIITAKISGINVFDQPAVEQGKQRAKSLLATGESTS